MGQVVVDHARDPRFEGASITEAVARALADPDCHIVNRNRGSGTRVLIDGLLQGRKPPGCATKSSCATGRAACI